MEMMHHYIMVEADIHLRLLPKSILDTSKLVEPLFAVSRAYGCTKYTILQAKLDPRFLEFRVTCGAEMMPEHPG
jgi:hypothetical protein